MRLFIVTVNYNNAQATERLLRSLKRQGDQAFGAFVIDNASESGDRARLEQCVREQYPQVQLIKSAENRGFSGGNNMGIGQALAQGADWILLLNNDTWVEEDFIASVKRHLASAGSSLIGIPLREGDRVAYAGMVTWLTPTMRHIYDPKDLKDRRTYAIGGGVLMSRDLLSRVGPWDERYFLYFEDVDFSERARRAGYEISIAEGLCIDHAMSGTTKTLGVPSLLRYHARNALLFNSLYAPWYVRIALPFVSVFGILVQIAKIIVRPRTAAESRATIAGILDFYRGRFGKIRLS